MDTMQDLRRRAHEVEEAERLLEWARSMRRKSVIKAHTEGFSVTKIAKAAGMTRANVYLILKN